MRLSATVLIAALVGVPSQPARADHPALVFAASSYLIAGAVLSASIVASAIIVAATLEDDDNCDCPETETRGEDNDNGGGSQGSGDGGEDGAPPEGGGGGGQGLAGDTSGGPIVLSRGARVSGTATQPGRVTFDDSSTNAKVTGFIDRRGELAVQRGANGYVTASVGYSFDGNVVRAPSSIRQFRHGEGLRFDLTLDTKAIRSSQACVDLSMKGIQLTTEDVPQTSGAVRLTFIVIQNGKLISTRELLARQGQLSQRPHWARGNGWVFGKGRIDINDASIPIPCTPNANGTPTELTFAMNMELVGKRT